MIIRRIKQKKYQTFGASKQAGQFSGITGNFAYKKKLNPLIVIFWQEIKFK